jgi:hypothetical protein
MQNVVQQKILHDVNLLHENTSILKDKTEILLMKIKEVNQEVNTERSYAYI